MGTIEHPPPDLNPKLYKKLKKVGTTRRIGAGIPFSIPLGVWGLGCSNFLE